MPDTPPSRPQSHQKGAITNHWNDLPAGYIPSPTNSLSRSASRNSNTLATPNPGSSISRTASASPLRHSSSTSGAEADGPSESRTSDETKPLDVLLPALYNLHTKLSRNEHSMLQARINKSLLPPKGDGGVLDSQRLWIRELLQNFVVDGAINVQQAREEIVAFMRRETGVAGWAGAVRKIVESVL
ncbi:hypothetical protein TWF696_001161 [Orbilia brochopaga]|uniref:Uncharacterized protein n=1 Tax=Orbilia brochopaga TaxID=3140254 RepID=A0AAV9VDK9_9PEZI